MSTYIHAISPLVPDYKYSQNKIRDMIKAQPELDRLGQRLVNSVFNASDIDERYSVVEDFLGDDKKPDGLFFSTVSEHILSPTTGIRNDAYTVEAAKLFIRAAHEVLLASDIKPTEITHIITVSCTGFFSPGPDYTVIRSLGLSPNVHRFHLGFMGCHAVFPALKMANAFCEANPEAVVLVISVELCTVQTHSSNKLDVIIANSVFADGAGALVVSGKTPSSERSALRIDCFATSLTPPGTGENDIVWTINDDGFNIVLSSQVPSIIETYIQEAMMHLTSQDETLNQTSYNMIKNWAIHPGGRAILDKVQDNLNLDAKQLEPSRKVLRQYGNMSSATIIFVLNEAWKSSHSGERVCAVTFGPGLTIESALFTNMGVSELQES